MPEPPLEEIVIWPYRSLDPSGIRRFLLILGGAMAFWAAVVIFMPRSYFAAPSRLLLSLIVIPPFLLVLTGVTYAFRVNARAARRCEIIRFYETEMSVERVGWSDAPVPWRANPYWVQVTIDNNTQIENRLTLRERSGGGVSVGEFLSPDERVALSRDLREVIQRHRAGTLGVN